MFIDPWANKTSLRSFFSKLKEDGELDQLMIIYERDILGHKIIQRPSKGPYGEKGKDIVVVEDQINNSYCSYIVKQGKLSENLNGSYGIIKQMQDAMRIPLEGLQYTDSKRTARIVHNDYEGYRGAIAKYEAEKQALETEFSSIMLRSIERWDLDMLTELLFPHGDQFKESERIRNFYEIREKICEIAIEHMESMVLKNDNGKLGESHFITQLKQLELEHGYSFKNTWGIQ